MSHAAGGRARAPPFPQAAAATQCAAQYARLYLKFPASSRRRGAERSRNNPPTAGWALVRRLHKLCLRCRTAKMSRSVAGTFRAAWVTLVLLVAFAAAAPAGAGACGWPQTWSCCPGNVRGALQWSLRSPSLCPPHAGRRGRGAGTAPPPQPRHGLCLAPLPALHTCGRAAAVCCGRSGASAGSVCGAARSGRRQGGGRGVAPCGQLRRDEELPQVQAQLWVHTLVRLLGLWERACWCFEWAVPLLMAAAAAALHFVTAAQPVSPALPPAAPLVMYRPPMPWGCGDAPRSSPPRRNPRIRRR